MLAGLQKQKINRRHIDGKRPQFALIVEGARKSIWETKAHTPVKVRTSPQFGKYVELIINWTKNNKIPFFLAAGIATVAAALILGMSMFFFSPADEPVLLPHDPLFSVVLDENVFVNARRDMVSRQKTKAYFEMTLATYTVKNNDTLEKIAKKMNVDLSTLISFNKISDAKSVHSGSVLSIPNKKGVKHIVRSGESLLQLSNIYNVSMDDLLDWNNLKSTTILKGQELFIPNGRLSSAAVNKVIGKSFVWPAVGRISSPFGPRISPISGTWHNHNGIDIQNKQGTTIVAARSGRVVKVDYNNTYGNFIIIEHDEGFQTLYGHLYKVLVKRNEYVQQNQKIGLMGTTGASTGPHLHFSIYTKSGAVDPKKNLPK
ncbi:MAG: M23 family metallopeptidase [Spirochaetales bacterium]|nr:M23 family metallopeptidase [Spirochaetales bacterium]